MEGNGLQRSGIWANSTDKLDTSRACIGAVAERRRGGGGVDEDGGGEEDDREAAILLEVAGDFAVWPSRMDSWVGDLLGRCRVPNSCRERQRGMA